jgi:hypothetical protein
VGKNRFKNLGTVENQKPEAEVELCLPYNNRKQKSLRKPKYFGDELGSVVAQ